MTPARHPRATDAVDDGHGEDQPFVRWSGRIGYAAKGVVYLIIGSLALMQVLGIGGDSTGSKGALVALKQQSYGDVLLYLMAGGLLMYTAWRFAQGLFDVEHKGNDFIALVKRGGLAISGALYGFLAWQALNLAMDSADRSPGGDSRETAARAMSEPGGEWLVIGVGIGFGIAGLYQLWRAWKVNFSKHWKSTLNGTTRQWATRVSRFGIAARAILFVIVAYYITVAGIESDPERTRSLGDVLRSFAGNRGLLGLAAAGLTCYAAYAWVNALFRRIPAASGTSFNDQIQ